MARWSNTHCPNAVYWGLAGWYRTFNEGGRVSDWFPYTFLTTID